MGKIKNTYEFYSENLKGRDNLGDMRVDRRIILKLILKA
jgi:hypothetical protein